jgi:hypothetical protein
MHCRLCILIVTEPASGREKGVSPPLPNSRFRNINAKTTMHCFPGSSMEHECIIFTQWKTLHTKFSTKHAWLLLYNISCIKADFVPNFLAKTCFAVAV